MDDTLHHALFVTVISYTFNFNAIKMTKIKFDVNVAIGVPNDAPPI